MLKLNMLRNFFFLPVIAVLLLNYMLVLLYSTLCSHLVR